MEKKRQGRVSYRLTKNKHKKMSKIEEYVRLRRKSRGITQDSMAGVLKVSASTYKRQEKQGFDTALLVRIAEYLDFEIVFIPKEANITRVKGS